MHRVNIKVSAQVTTLTYMHQSQPSLHSLRIHFTVHLELCPGNHLFGAMPPKIVTFKNGKAWQFSIYDVLVSLLAILLMSVSVLLNDNIQTYWIPFTSASTIFPRWKLHASRFTTM